MNVITEFKSITSLRPCKIATFLLFLITFIISMRGVAAENNKRNIINELPTSADLDLYLTPLENIVGFCIKHKLYVDLNLEFGLFLSSVNLKSTLINKRNNIPSKILFRLEQLLLKNDVLAEYFRVMVEKTKNNIASQESRAITRLFHNDSEWARSAQKFNIDLLKQTKVYSTEELEKIYGEWEIYENNVLNFEKYKPSPEDSDSCMANLAENPTNYNIENTSTNCQTPPECKQTVNSGSEFGYGLSHRILFLIIAHHARGCIVFSVKEDKYKVDKYCMRTFNEMQFIVLNNYQLPDLMMEQIAMCSFIGHAQFLRRSWITRLLGFQTYEGCFTVQPVSRNDNEEPMFEGKSDEWKISSETQMIMGNRCNSHTTAVAAAMLSSAIRYIMENYY